MGITPIDEDTEFGELRPVLIEEIKFPEGINILEFESELSRSPRKELLLYHRVQDQ